MLYGAQVGEVISSMDTIFKQKVFNFLFFNFRISSQKAQELANKKNDEWDDQSLQEVQEILERIKDGKAKVLELEDKKHRRVQEVKALEETLEEREADNNAKVRSTRNL